MNSNLLELGIRARQAATELALCDGKVKNRALHAAAKALLADKTTLLAANAKDMSAAHEKGLSAALLDRLELDDSRVQAMARSVSEIAELDDPIGALIASWQRPNGLIIERRRVPLGVIGIIYESRPNVTADAAALCVKSGNAVILRGGSESFYSSSAIYACINRAFDQAGLPSNCVQMVATTSREAVGQLLSGLEGHIDLLIPRGGKSLISRVQHDARVPVMGHLDGICHVYVHHSANLDQATAILLNAKMRRTGVCGAAETVLLDQALSQKAQRSLLCALLDAGCEVRADQTLCALDERLILAQQEDWGREFLGPIIAARQVENLAQAIEHIRTFGSGHTDSIIAEEAGAAETFCAQVDSAIVMHNTSTQFADGGEFGMGAEIGIATGKLHARGPVGVEQLTSYKYVVRGDGQIRPV